MDNELISEVIEYSDVEIYLTEKQYKAISKFWKMINDCERKQNNPRAFVHLWNKDGEVDEEDEEDDINYILQMTKPHQEYKRWKNVLQKEKDFRMKMSGLLKYYRDEYDEYLTKNGINKRSTNYDYDMHYFINFGQRVLSSRLYCDI